MKRSNAKPLSPEELQDLEKLRSMIEQAIADGYARISHKFRLKQLNPHPHWILG
jgi:hypothetical protein